MNVRRNVLLGACAVGAVTLAVVGGGRPQRQQDEIYDPDGLVDPDFGDQVPFWLYEEPGPGDGAGGIWDTNGSRYFYNDGNVGIGTTNPQHTLHIKSERAKASFIDNLSTEGSRYAVFARSRSTSGKALYAHANASEGVTYGVWGRSDSNEGFAGYFEQTNDDGTGMNFALWARNDNPTGYAGMYTGNFRVDLGSSMFDIFQDDNTPFVRFNGNSNEIEINDNDELIYRFRPTCEEFTLHNDFSNAVTIELDADDGGGNGGRIFVDGDLSVTNNKNAIVEMESGERRLVYSTESPEVWFEDLGSGRLIMGEARIDLDPEFLQIVTINEEHPMRVLVTLTSDSTGVYVQKFHDHFIVKELRGGLGAATFDYKVMAKRRGHEDKRLEVFEWVVETGARADRNPVQIDRGR